MLRSKSDDNYSLQLIKLVKEFSNRTRKLQIGESFLLAEKELSQLESRLKIYKNLVELAVHLD